MSGKKDLMTPEQELALGELKPFNPSLIEFLDTSFPSCFSMSSFVQSLERGVLS